MHRQGTTIARADTPPVVFCFFSPRRVNIPCSNTPRQNSSPRALRNSSRLAPLQTGDCVGEWVGDVDGAKVGVAELGNAVGDAVGTADVGEVVGDAVGTAVVGETVGDLVGSALVGVWVGADVVGAAVGPEVVGDRVGEVVGLHVTSQQWYGQ